jgi:hypothetical protein
VDIGDNPQWSGTREAPPAVRREAEEEWGKGATLRVMPPAFGGRGPGACTREGEGLGG